MKNEIEEKMSQEDKKLPDLVTIYTIIMVTINGRLVKPYGQSDSYWPGAKRRDFKPSESRRIFQTENHKEYLAKKKEWIQEYQNDRNTKKAARIKAKTPVFLNEEIKKIVDILFEKQRESILFSLQTMYGKFLETLKTLEGFSSWSKEVKEAIGPYSVMLQRLYNKMMEVPGKSTYSPNEPKYLKKNHVQIMKAMIDEEVKSIMAAFLLKMQIKLCDTIKQKKIKEFKSSGMHNGWVYFIFEDGSKFSMENSIEYGHSKYGLLFQRFPCRFKDVILSDGTKMKQPNEEKMKKEF